MNLWCVGVVLIVDKIVRVGSWEVKSRFGFLGGLLNITFKNKCATGPGRFIDLLGIITYSRLLTGILTRTVS